MSTREKRASTEIEIDVRADLVTREGSRPREWAVDGTLPGLSGWWVAGRVYEHESGDRSGYQAQLKIDPGLDMEIDPETFGYEREPGLGFASQADAVYALARAAAAYRIRCWHKAGTPEDADEAERIANHAISLIWDEEHGEDL